jgi:hypothetical protein
VRARSSLVSEDVIEENEVEGVIGREKIQFYFGCKIHLYVSFSAPMVASFGKKQNASGSVDVKGERTVGFRRHLLES